MKQHKMFKNEINVEIGLIKRQEEDLNVISCESIDHSI